MKLRSGLNQMRLDLKPGESARIRYVLRCPLEGPLHHRTCFPAPSQHVQPRRGGDEVDHHSDVIVFPQVKDVEEAFLRSRTPKMYTGATRSAPRPRIQVLLPA